MEKTKDKKILEDTMQRILIVDDAEVNREMLREILAADYIVDMAANGQEAIQKLL